MTDETPFYNSTPALVLKRNPASLAHRHVKPNTVGQGSEHLDVVEKMCTSPGTSQRGNDRVRARDRIA